MVYSFMVNGIACYVPGLMFIPIYWQAALLPGIAGGSPDWKGRPTPRGGGGGGGGGVGQTGTSHQGASDKLHTGFQGACPSRSSGAM